MRRALEREPRAPRVIRRLEVPFAGAAAWLAQVDPDAARLAWLGQAERARAARLSDPDAARRYVAERCTIRRIVATHLGGRADAVRLESAGGRPFLPGHPGTHISIARRQGHVAVALADCGVGIDVEIATRPLDAIAVRLFHASDPPVACPEDFYALWTRKEAAFKASGTFAVFDPAEPMADATADGSTLSCASLRDPRDDVFIAIAVACPVG